MRSALGRSAGERHCIGTCPAPVTLRFFRFWRRVCPARSDPPYRKGRPMSEFDLRSPISRRHVFALGGSVAAGGALAGLAAPGSAAARGRRLSGSLLAQSGRLPDYQMQQILQAQGSVSEGVLQIDIDRDDIGEVSGPEGVTFTPSFEVDGTLTFQPLGNNL